MELNFNIPEGDMSAAGIASSSLKKKFLQLGISPAIIKKAVISLYEAEINMVIHGGGGDVHIDITPEIVTMVIADKGPGIPDIDLAMQEGYSTATDMIREMGFGAGMGLPNIKKNSDFMEINSKPGEGTTVTIKVKLA
ncbi:MAG: ATP-binding protein [Spirochaetaceae bacterium]|nr:ATP-binding protein [Spirochaetaceae bacterium]